MSNYAKITDFAIKDSLATGNPAKAVRGEEHDAEYNAIATAISSKADTNSPSFVGPVSFQSANCSGTITAVTFSGALSGNASTATSANSASTAGTATNATNLQTTNWRVFESGGYLYFQYAGVTKARLDPTGYFNANGDVIAFSGV